MILNKGLLNASQINKNYTFNGLLNTSQINGVGIYNILGLVIGDERPNIENLIFNFKNRVSLDSGYFTGESCLIATLTKLNLQYPPLLITAPIITGSVAVGSVMSVSNGVFDGISPLIYTYQWLLNGNLILGATNNTYITENLGTISCKVTATNSFGTVESTSNSLVIVYDNDYVQILNYATTLGYVLPSSPQKIKQSKLILNLKTAGIWNKLDSFANFANDGSSNFALIDWKRLSLFTAVNSPTFIPNVGFKGNGVSSYINMNIAPAGNTKYLSGNSSIGVWFNNILTRTNNSIGLGVRTAGNNNSSGISPYDATRFIAGLNNPSAAGGFDTPLYTRPTKGYLIATRNNLNDFDTYVNGVFNSTVVKTENTIFSPFNYFSLALNNGGTPSAFSDDEISIIHIGGSVNGDSLAFYNAINNYLTSL